MKMQSWGHWVHPWSEVTSPNERPFMISYMSTIQTKSLSLIVFEIFMEMQILGSFGASEIRGHITKQKAIYGFQLRSFMAEIWLLKGVHMLSIRNRLISCQSTILDRNFRMRLRASMGPNRHCLCTGMSNSGQSLLRSDCGSDQTQPEIKMGPLAAILNRSGNLT